MDKLKKIAVFLLKSALILIVVGGAIIGGAMYHVFRADPKVIYDIYFDTPIGLAHNLKGGGVSWMGHDAHMRFDSDEEFHLKNPDKYAAVDPIPVAQYVETFFPRDRESLEDTQNLTCLATSGMGPQTKFYGEYFLENKRTKAHFFISNYAH